MKILSILSALLAVILAGFIISNLGLLTNSVRAAASGDDASAELADIRALDDADLLRFSAETYATSHATAIWHLARYVSYFYAALIALVVALITLALIARRAPNRSFKPNPSRSAVGSGGQALHSASDTTPGGSA